MQWSTSILSMAGLLVRSQASSSVCLSDKPFIGMTTTRSLGDWPWKIDQSNYESKIMLATEKQFVTCKPETATVKLTKEHEFLILASDGKHFVSLVEFKS